MFNGYFAGIGYVRLETYCKENRSCANGSNTTHSWNAVSFRHGLAGRALGPTLGSLRVLEVDYVVLHRALTCLLCILSQIIVPLYILRTVLTSCGWPLINSVLNDYTPKKHRAKFNSMQSIAGFGYEFEVTFFRFWAMLSSKKTNPLSLSPRTPLPKLIV